MIDDNLANSLATSALSLWEAGELEQAASQYASAIAVAPKVPDWHMARGGVLQQLSRHEEATTEYEAAVALELAQHDSEAYPGVKVARYFLADHLVTQGNPAKALEVLAPAVAALPDDWLVGTAQALALFAIGRKGEARSVAKHAISNAGWESKKAELTERLTEVLAACNG